MLSDCEAKYKHRKSGLITCRRDQSQDAHTHTHTAKSDRELTNTHTPTNKAVLRYCTAIAMCVCVDADDAALQPIIKLQMVLQHTHTQLKKQKSI